MARRRPSPDAGQAGPPALTPREEAFCQAFSRHGNAVRAAREIGIPPERALVVGQRMRRKPALRQRIEQLHDVPRMSRAAEDSIRQRLVDAVDFPSELFFQPRPLPPELGLQQPPLPCDLSALSAREIAVIKRLLVTVQPTRDGGVGIGGTFMAPDRLEAIRRLLRFRSPDREGR